MFDFFTGCGDILTKPKLEKHREMCLASFDCIDCSKHFETPAEYKAHTSCISEAEKYQKTLYHGVVSKHFIRNTWINPSNHSRDKVAPKAMVETIDHGNRALVEDPEEGNRGTTDNGGNRGT